MATKTIKIRIEPRFQFREFLESTKRWAVLVAHRRAGKTVAVVQKLIKCALEHKKRPGAPPRYAYIAPTRDQAKDIAWGYLKDFTRKIPGVIVNEAELKITLPHNKASIRLYSGENYERMRGIYFDGVVSDEDADIPAAAFDFVILPCLLDYDGWHIRIGTPKGRNSFWNAWKDAKDDPDSFTLMLKASESGILSPSALAVMKRKARSEDAYLQEMECDFSIGRPGAIYAKLLEQSLSKGRIIDFDPLPDELVFTTWDLGAPENTRAVYWQFVGNEIQAIDHDTNLDLTPEDRVKHMEAKGYQFGMHIFPHDAGAKEKSGKNFEEQMREAGLKDIVVLPRCSDPWVGINKVKQLFPRFVFRKTPTKYLRDSLDAYHRKEDKKAPASDAQYVTSSIVHNWASHDSDAVRTLGEAILNGVLKDGTQPPPKKIKVISPMPGIGDQPSRRMSLAEVLEAEDDEW